MGMGAEYLCLLKDRSVRSWALYDWANSAFATTVMAGFFPILYREFFHQDGVSEVVSFRYGLTNSAASILVALLAPLLGALADRTGRGRGFLVTFALLGIAATILLAGLPSGAWLLASAVFALALIGFSGSIIFYDALLPQVSLGKSIDRVSALGYSLGYLGGGLLFALNVYFVSNFALFGMSSLFEAMQWCFVSVGVWWLLFALPLFRAPASSPSRRDSQKRMHEIFISALQELLSTVRTIRGYRPVFLFLLAYWLYIDGVNSVMRLAVSYGVSIGIETTHLIQALLLTQFVGFPAALLFGSLGARFGARPLIIAGISGYVVATVLASFMTTELHFYALAVFVGLFQGGVQALSRSYFGSIIPPEKSAEFFGFYNLVGKFTAIVGPMAVGLLGLALGSDRLGILALLVLFAAGIVILTLIPTERPGEKSRSGMCET